MPIVHETVSLDCGTLVHEVMGSLPLAELKREILFMCLYAGVPICLVDDNLGSEDPFSFSVTFMQCLHCGGRDTDGLAPLAAFPLLQLLGSQCVSPRLN